MEKKKQPPTPKEQNSLRDTLVRNGFAADPMGSYTGRPIDPFEQPVQDADDL